MEKVKLGHNTADVLMSSNCSSCQKKFNYKVVMTLLLIYYFGNCFSKESMTLIASFNSYSVQCYVNFVDHGHVSNINKAEFTIVERYFVIDKCLGVHRVHNTRGCRI